MGETFVVNTGARATRSIEMVDDVEPEFVALVRSMAHWLDPSFPDAGLRNAGVRGGWTDDDGQVQTEFTQFEELTPDGRGIRILRLYRIPPSGPPYEGAIRVIALGIADGGRLELRWNFIASEFEVRGTSAELTVEGPRPDECVQDFQRWFEREP